MKTTIIALLALTAVFFGYQQVRSMDTKMETPMNQSTANTHSAVFAGGCFWCTESDFEKIDGVVEVVSGYTGGQVDNPTYNQVSAGGTGHVEAVKVIYDPHKVTYAQLLDYFWRHVDPTDAGGQFVDRGNQYRSVIFYADEEQRQMAEASKKALAAAGRFDRPIMTSILPLGVFYEAEAYHQDYYKKNPIRYNWYRSGSGRDQFLRQAWAGAEKMMKKADMATPMATDKKEMAYPIPTDDQLKTRLSDLQYRVARENGTEPPFNNEYWDNHKAGIYVDIVSASPCSARRTSLTRAPAGPASPVHWSRTMWSRKRIRRSSWCAPRCAASMPTPTWAMYSTTAPSPPACATASTRHPCGLSRPAILKKTATASIGNCSRSNMKIVEHGWKH